MPMSPTRLFHLTSDHLRTDAISAFLACLGVVVGIAALSFFIALGTGVRQAVQTKFFPTDVAALEVIPPTMSLGITKLDESAFQRLAILDGVQSAFRKMEVRVPAMASPNLELSESFRVPKNIRVALIAVGVESDFVAKDTGKSFRLSQDKSPTGERALPKGPIPAMASDRLLALYNRAFAKSQGLPTVSGSLLEAAQGVPLVAVHLGRSMAGGHRFEDGYVDLSFAGLSSRAPLHGVLIPLEAARAINRAYGQDSETYSAVTLIAQDPSKLPALRQEVSNMGFSIDDSDRELSERIGLVIALITAAFAILSVLICAVSAINIAHTLLSSTRLREREFALMRAVGATRRDIAWIVISEAITVGILGGVFGFLTSRLAAFLILNIAATSLAQLPIAPRELFLFSKELFVLSLSVAVLSSLAGAIFPAWKASRTSPAKLLAGG